MREKWHIKSNKSFRENAGIILPEMFDEMVSHKDRVILHPRLKSELHQMRIAGKPLRYAMELFETTFGKEFKGCLEEIKKFIELLGQIHDIDIAIPVLQSHLREVRILNQGTADRKERIKTKVVRELIRQQRDKRNLMFTEMCNILEKWEKANFREKLIKTI